MNAFTVPVVVARPAQCSRVPSSSTRSQMKSTSSPNVEIASPSIDHMPSSPRRWPSLLSRAATLWITIVYCWRSSSASANKKARSSCSTNSAIVQ